MQKKTMALLIGGLLALPMAAAASTLEEQTVVAGHTMYADMSGFDEDIAAVAGLAESRVVWFNGRTIMSTLGEGYVYAVESGAVCSPLEGQNYTFLDYELSFLDPNDQGHISAHYTYRCPTGLLDPIEPIPEILGLSGTYHVWVTTTHARVQDAPITPGDAGRLYNFALAVDTSAMTQGEQENHSEEGGRTTSEINRGEAYCPEEDVHSCNAGDPDGDHSHNTAAVDLFFSRADRGEGAATDDPSLSHPGTEAGCAADAHCAAVTDPNATWQDPNSST